MKLTEVMAVWDRLDEKNIRFSDLENALDRVIGVENDLTGPRPSTYEDAEVDGPPLEEHWC